MVYKKYIKRGGKRFGPYYFKTYRAKNGSVKSIYLGRDYKPKPKLDLRLTLVIVLVTLVLAVSYGNYTAFVSLEEGSSETPAEISSETDSDIETGNSEEILSEEVLVEEEIIEENPPEQVPVEELPIEEVNNEFSKHLP